MNRAELPEILRNMSTAAAESTRRKSSGWSAAAVLSEAADEIETLRATRAQLNAEIAQQATRIATMQAEVDRLRKPKCANCGEYGVHAHWCERGA